MSADAAPLLRLEGVGRDFDVSRPWLNRVLEGTPRQLLHAVDDVSFEVRRGETLALVGESGCGKSTLARLIVGLYAPSRGRIAFDGVDIGDPAARAQTAKLRRRMQMIFQDPYASLNPRWRVRKIVAEPLRVLGLAHSEEEIRPRVAELLRQVGLAAEDGEKFPHEFSGGQRQRVAIARALIVQPRVLVLDEPTSALDVTIQQQVLSLLQRLQREMGLSYLLITHDMEVIRSMAHRVLVMKDGEIVENGPVFEVLDAPSHPYTQRLVAAALARREAPKKN